MSITDANQILFRASGVHHIMGDPKSKTEKLSEGCKTHLIDLFVSAKYGRREEQTNKFVEKGNIREEDSITLLSRVTKRFFKKNTIRLNNDLTTGEPDLFDGVAIEKADETIDTKTSWSAHTFFRSTFKKLDDSYYWQGQTYMSLTGAGKHTVAFCLVNGTEQAITDEKRKLAWKMGIIDPSSVDEYYEEKCKLIERNHIFDLAAFEKEYPWFELHSNPNQWQWDIPMKERLTTFEFERDETAIAAMHNRILECREWMNENLFRLTPERIEIEGV